MKEALVDTFKKYFWLTLVVACFMLLISPLNLATFSVMRDLIAATFTGVVIVLFNGFLDKNWKRAISLGVMVGATFFLVDLCYWLIRS